MNKINKRLKLLINWIEEEKNLKIIADIGTDHGKLPIKLSENDENKFIFGIDIVKSIIKKLNEEKIYKNIKWIHGFGLNPLQDQKLDLVIIAGMGIIKILKILKLDSNLQENIIIQTKENLEQIRNWLNIKEYSIKKENILEEKGHFYHSIFITKNKREYKKLSKNEIFFGPLLIMEKSKDFINYWNKTLKFLKINITKIKNKEQKTKFNNKIEKIEKILNNE